MKNLIIFSMLIIMVVINFTGCGQAEQRLPKVNQKIAGDVVQMSELADITKAERQDSPENMAFKQQLISKIENTEKRNQAVSLLAQNRLVYMFMEGKVVLLEFMPATVNKHATATATVATTTATPEAIEAAQAEDQVIMAKTMHTYESLMAMKEGRAEHVEALKTSTWSQNHFIVLTEIAMQTGILENERTDYNEKKSTLGLTETALAQAQVIVLKSEIKAAVSTADASGGEQQ